MIDEVELARVKLGAWNDVAAWLGHTALEFVPDETTRGYLLHVSECVSDEGERRYAHRAGLADTLEASRREV